MNENAAPEAASANVGACSLVDFQPFHPAEAKVLAGLNSGDFNRIGNGLCPDGNDGERTVRAEVLRILILGNDDDLRARERVADQRRQHNRGPRPLRAAESHAISL
jgi:hypothetical protein